MWGAHPRPVRGIRASPCTSESAASTASQLRLMTNAWLMILLSGGRVCSKGRPAPNVLTVAGLTACRGARRRARKPSAGQLRQVPGGVHAVQGGITRLTILNGTYCVTLSPGKLTPPDDSISGVLHPERPRCVEMALNREQSCMILLAVLNCGQVCQTACPAARGALAPAPTPPASSHSDDRERRRRSR